jgi:hypothetical protein
MSRGGVEIGGEHVRLRVELQLMAAYAHTVEPGDADQPVRETGFQTGVSFGVGLTVR